MRIVIRNITKDTMTDFNYDYLIELPMEEEKLVEFLGNDEWIIVDSPIGEELTNIEELNDLLQNSNIEDIEILSKTYLLNEVKEMIDSNEYIIIDFDKVTSNWNYGNGVYADDNWKGFVIHSEGYDNYLPFEYKEEMEDWIQWEQVWFAAETDGWRDVIYNGKHYIVRRY